jgi:hypothetical protein
MRGYSDRIIQFIGARSKNTRDADKSLARPGRNQARKHVRDARDFNNIETRTVIKFLFLQGKAPKEILAILTETLACFLPGRAKDLSASLYLTSPGLDYSVRAIPKCIFTIC